MKCNNSFISPLLLAVLLSATVVSCKKDPIENAKSDLFEKLKGTWVLTDYSMQSSGYFTGMSGYGSSSFSNNIVTDTNITRFYDSVVTTTVRTATYSYVKHLDFIKYRNDRLYYTESTIKSDVETTTENRADWTDLTMSGLVIKIEDEDCILSVDGSDNLILVRDNSYFSVGSGGESHYKWTFTKE